MTVGILFATLSEANPFLAMYPFEEGREEGPRHFNHIDKIILVVSGMGPANARDGMAWLCKQKGVDEIWNGGIAGALKDGFPVGEIYKIDRAQMDGQSIETSFAQGDERLGQHSRAKLVTVSKPVFDDESRAKLASLGDLVDMEGAVVASIGRDQNKKVFLIKGISDLAGNSDRQILHQNLGEVSEKVARVMREGIGL